MTNSGSAHEGGVVPPPPWETNLHLLIEAQAARTPQAQAVCFGDEVLTYAELEARAGRCAQYLRGLGVGPDVIVGVLMERSSELVVALLAILKAGGAYLPLDPSYPRERLNFLLKDAGVTVVLTQAPFKPLVQEFEGPVRALDGWSRLLSGDASPPASLSSPTDLAYVIYTSGSTGQPKGCMLPHRAICNRLQWMQKEYGLTAQDRVLQKTPYTFDVSVWEFFWPLMAGATLVLAAPQGHKDANYLAEFIRRESITVCHFVPSMLRFFLGAGEVKACTSLRAVFVSGEALPFELLQRFKETLPAQLHNLYGPTEAAVDVSYWACEMRPDRKVPIGRAIDNIQLYVMDAECRPVPAGEEGELYIGGVGLARGYLNRPALSAERFVPHPGGRAGERLYRTGDRARELPDGNIEFLGRADFQVKLRGLRIELGEIEAVLREYPGVTEVAVLVRDEDVGDAKLVAYLEAPQPLAAKAVRQFAGVRLPEYMVPTAVVTLPQLPVTVHGKLERNALPWPVASAAPAPAAATPPAAAAVPTQAMADQISGLAAEALRKNTLDADTDLFDLGATSLTMVRIVERIKHFFDVSVPVDVFLDAPTIRSIAGYVAAQRGAAAPAAEPLAAPSPAALPEPQSIALLPAAFRPSAYEAATPCRQFRAERVPFAAFSGWLGLLRSGERDGVARYLYPSAGGLNAVRAYVVVREGGVQELPAGTYYHHPEENTLYRVGDPIGGQALFGRRDQKAFEAAGFAVVLIAALDAIAPLYMQASEALATLEAGYIGQLLLGRQADFGLGVAPVAGMDFDRVKKAFDLSENECFLHCLVGGLPLSSALQAEEEAADAWPQAPGSRPAAPALFDLAEITPQAGEQLHAEHRNLRRFDGTVQACPLQEEAFAWDDYRLRACRRDYERTPVALKALSGLLALCRPKPGDGTHLYGSVTGQHELMVFVYAREGGVEGLAEGVYAYDAARHALVRKGSVPDAQMAAAYTPFNRKHYKGSAFSLFVFERSASSAQARGTRHMALLDTGYLGQLLVERQAEFGLGLCPIGGLRFDKIGAAFGLEDGAEPLQSFTAGVFRQEVPASRRVLAVEPPGQTAAAPGTAGTQPLAIVGLSGRYPGAADLPTYWANLRAGRTSIAALPLARQALLAQGEVPSLGMGAYLEDIDCFDSVLFRIAPAQARSLDPQERLLLQSAWACLEDAGYTAPSLLDKSARVGVFIGAMWNDYQSHGVQAWQDHGAAAEASHHASLANRLSYTFNFSGPSVAINTSCSSAMTALHFACESIKRGECDAALVGGVNLVSHAYHARLLEGLEMLSGDGVCRPFSAEANGWVLGEGVSTVLLKPLRQAEQDGDTIHGVICGSAIGHSGRTVRYGAPSTRQQAHSMRQALASAGLQAHEIGYIEAAAPGASLADATEAQAIQEVFGHRPGNENQNQNTRTTYVGTVKANIGHLESASALSQLSKVLCQLKAHEFAPSLHSRPRNPLIGLEGKGLAIVEALTPWASEGPRRALINVVGAAGSAGHVVVEEYCAPARERVTDRPTVVPLSAATAERLGEHARRLLAFVQEHPEVPLADIAHTLRVGRVEMAERLALVVGSRDALEQALQAHVNGEVQASAAAGASSDLHTQAQAWIQGAAAAWPHDPLARKVALPAYPFEPVRHWLGAGSQAEVLEDTGQDGLQDEADGTNDDAVLREKTQRYLVRLLARVTELPLARVGLDTALEDCGLSSLMVHALNTQLEQDVGGLSKTLFFEHRTLREVAEHLLDSRAQALRARFQLGAPVARVQASSGRSRSTSRSIRPGPHPRTQEQEIAIIGLAGRYPQARDVQAYWANLLQGLDCISEIPTERWDHSRYYDPQRGQPGKSYSKWGGFIDGVDEFDPLFFNISPREAEAMDPQERLFLQTVWETFEDAGYSREALKRTPELRVGVFAGVMYSEYQLYPSLPQGLSLSGSIGSIANRVSYVLDLHGPSLTVDTMCSSSLTAIHLACASLRRGECEAAIAGGVNVSVHPSKYATQALMTMSSSDGRCRSFGEGGDGFVPGEGVGAVLLKPLSKAIQDGDQIYGVIKGSAINHGGKTNGYTVPDPRAQARMIEQALQDSGVNARAVSYIEAHGTGTSLGDPIEIAGLSKAFAAHTADKQYCAIGSAKSNIGHAESAAGIAGLTKVLLQMKHKTLVKSLHSEVLNPNIDFQGTPFVVQQETAEWRRPVIEGREQARIAGISSFGAGGSNAHLIIQEYTQENTAQQPRAAQTGPVVVVLSARNEERLKEQAQRLLQAMQDTQSLHDIAYTLQVGREAMEVRLACVVDTAQELSDKLTAYLEGKPTEELFTGEVKRNKEALAVFSAEDMQVTLQTWVAQGKLGKLADLWAKGYAIDWNLLHADIKPQRVSLPSYPFARERYWVPELPAQVVSGTSQLHPLLHSNTSSLNEQRFTSTFTGEEFFLKDHQVQGRKILPGVAQLEMARQAVVRAMELTPEQAQGVQLEGVVFASPIVVGDQPLQVHIALQGEDSGAISYEIYSQSGEEETVHGQGRASLREPQAPRHIELEALKAQCTQQLGHEQIYAAFAQSGLDYGAAFQGLHAVHTGQDEAGRIVLGELSLPEAVRSSQGEYALHPSLMDAALQAGIGLMLGSEADQQTAQQTMLPFALERLEVFAALPAQASVLIRLAAGSNTAVSKLDLSIVDAQGQECVRLSGFTSRALNSTLQTPQAVQTLLLAPEWQTQALPEVQLVPEQRHVLLCEVATEPNVPFGRLNSEGNIAERYTRHAQQLLNQLQAILHGKPMRDVLIQLVVPAQGEAAVLQGLAGLLKSAAQENPRLKVQLIAVEESDSAQLSAQLDAEAHTTSHQIRYQAGQREVRKLVPLSAPQTAQPLSKEGGVYLITGGAGGLGLIFAQAIAAQARHTTLVLTGRSELSATQQARLRQIPARVDYRRVDVNDAQALERLVGELSGSYGELSGVIHSAGVLRDSFLIKKTGEELQAVFAPKVSGLVHLDRATREQPLDYFIAFSSTAGVLGNVGQGDYAAANAFMDEYLAQRPGPGRSLSVNWPLWDEGGMQLDATSRERMWKSLGLSPLASQAGVNALGQALAGSHTQVMVLSGDPLRLPRILLEAPAAKPAATPATAASSPASVQADAGELSSRIEAALTRMVAVLLKIDAADLDRDAELSEFGFDSISLTSFSNQLNQQYGLELTPTVFFEHPTLAKLSRHLAAEHAAALAPHFSPRTSSSATPAPLPVAVPLAPGRQRRSRFSMALPARSIALAPNEPIAIIGISASFPQARDMDAFWENLKAGKDCIQEIPDTRWDWSQLYGDPKTEDNKTNARRAGLMEDMTEFDPLFFGISPREAQGMDPQQRLLMTHVWRVLEDAGYAAHSLSGSDTALFVGTTSSGYSYMLGTAIEGSSATAGAASIGPNRMSYLLNLHGPSEPIETACSSALVAIHKAVQAIRSGHSRLAIAGGINTLVSPAVQVSFSKAGMLCEDGRCKTFSKHADGYVRGEGAGMLLLKKLSDAQADGDHIYGLIRGSAQNHGGRANSLTAPNPKAQAELIKTAFTQAGVEPKTVGYIEAHGTGTPLGDPIEIQGLKSAFKELSADLPEGYCGVGSVKTNIGHLELAAGVAGVIKVLLQMKHKTLVKSLHSEEINPYIDLKGSPFYIVQEARPWEALQDEQGQALPRRASVSSFGFGGVNAHVVMEEYVVPARARASQTGPVVVVLSARNEQRLREHASQLLQAIQETQQDLHDIAYTLQVGRDAMEVRLACVVDTTQELCDKLAAYLDGKPTEELFTGEVKRNKEALAVFSADEDLQRAIEAWVAKGKLAKLADLWVKGLVFDWSQLYAQAKPQRVSLPSYPFARERYWVPELPAQAAIGASQLHPLLHSNSSSLDGQRYSSTFTGAEFFLKDHQVQGRKVLPGVAQLEMARQAVQRASGHDASGIRLEQVVFARPVVVGDEPLQVHIALDLQAGGDIAYEIYSGSDETPVVHGQGRAVLGAAPQDTTQEDLAGLAAMCPHRLSAEHCYAAFSQAGFAYGASFRGLVSLQTGVDSERRPLAVGELSLPEAARHQGGFELHPSLLDAALQACAGLAAAGQQEAGRPMLPFALECLQVHRPVPEKASVVVRQTQSAEVHKVDLNVVDAQGRVCVSLSGFSSRAVQGGRDVRTLLLRPEWQAQETELQEAGQRMAWPARHVLLCGVGLELQQIDVQGAQIERLEAPGDTAERYGALAEQLLQRLQALIAAPVPVLVQLVVPVGDTAAGLSALLKSASQENSKLTGQVLQVEAHVGAQTLGERLQANAQAPAAQVRYVAGQRQVLKFVPQVPDEAAALCKDGGLYLITGGAGGLGLIVASALAAQAKNITLVLSGRSPLTAQKQEALKVLETQGAKIEYRVLDVSDAESVDELISEIQTDYGQLNGIFHSAGVLRDSFVLKKTKQELQAVFAPKVQGLVNLDRATKDMSLDSFIAFSSVSAVLGNVGQADYAAANAFMDEFMQARQGRRPGRSLSIDWPLWEDGGMQVDEAVRQRLGRAGFSTLQSPAGVAVLGQALSGGQTQALVLCGDSAGIERVMQRVNAAAPAFAAVVGAAEPVADQFQARLEAALRHMMSTQLQIGEQDLDRDTEFSEFGYDSISLIKFSTELNDRYGLELVPTIFFEHPTLARLSTHLAREHASALAPHFVRVHAAAVQPIQPVQTVQAAPAAAIPVRRRRARSAPLAAAKAMPAGDEPIAIIGISGGFPQARDIQAFWRNLEQGRDCIEEIPDSRWDWSELYGDPQQEGRKTNARRAGLLEGLAEFDPLFFGISPAEAQGMDPQQRLLMTHVWSVLEDAGYAAQGLSGSDTAIFVGTTSSGYGGLLAAAGQAVQGSSATGEVPSIGPNRMSYLLNLHGPSEPIETACSSALVAIHKAVQAVRGGHSRMAVAGGVNILVSADLHVSFSKAGMLCEDGRCKTFSKHANGYVRGEGVGMLLLKKLSDAEADGDHIYGVIKGSAQNHGGRANSLTAPNPRAQAELIKAAFRQAGVEPSTVGYIEAHGTGTPLGDPIEIEGLKSAFKELDPQLPAGYCGLGSVKTNIGHLELAAGVAGVIKVLLQMQHKKLVKSLHSEELNPYIGLEGSPFYVVQEARAWEALKDGHGREMPRRAGVSSFGFGGVNAHVVLEEYVAQQPLALPKGPVVAVLSAKNEDKLKEQARRLKDAIRGRTDEELESIAYTLQVGRDAMEARLACVVGSIAELAAKLDAYLQDQPADETYRGEVRRNKEALAVFAADEELQDAITKWLERGKLGQLADLWVKGLAFDWNRLYGQRKPQRVGLPTYPFARQRYWVEPGFAPAASAAQAELTQHDLGLYRELLMRLESGTLTPELALRAIDQAADGISA